MKNADCTLYKYDPVTKGFTRHFVPGVFWEESKGANVQKSGMRETDSTMVLLFSDAVYPEAPAKDMFVKGNCPFEFDNSSAQKISESLTSFRNQYRFVTVMSVDNRMFGNLPHVDISAK